MAQAHGIAALVCTRLRDLDLLPVGRLEALLEDTLRENGARGLFFETTTDRVMRALEGRGIPTLPLKGASLARSIYGDPALRRYGDVDVLVPAERLAAAAEVLRPLGYDEPHDPVRAGGLPELHLSLHHTLARLPPIELHWRVHWYEEEFSARMLARSRIDGERRRAEPADELAALLLFYARDGFVGLKLAADIAAWWDARGAELPAGGLDSVAERHPEIRLALATALDVAARLIGVPAEDILSRRPSGHRSVVAGRLANWTYVGQIDQIAANVTLIDALLSPRGGGAKFVRRSLVVPDDLLDDFYHLPPNSRAARTLWRVLHPWKLLARYAIALWRLRGGARWSPAGALPGAAPAMASMRQNGQPAVRSARRSAGRPG